MFCPFCGTDNAEGAKTCTNCGTSLYKACPSCAYQNPLDSKFCRSCGYSFVGEDDEEEPTKVLSTQKPAPKKEEDKDIVAIKDLIASSSLKKAKQAIQQYKMNKNSDAPILALEQECKDKISERESLCEKEVDLLISGKQFKEASNRVENLENLIGETVKTKSLKYRIQKSKEADAQSKKKAPKPSPKPTQTTKQSSSSKFIWIALALVVIVGGFLLYKLAIRPAQIDRNAPRYYPMADRTFLRSSMVTGIDANKLGKVMYGDELITYNIDSEWAQVKTPSGQKGYVAADYLLDKNDFFLLNSIWGDTDSKEVIATTKCRRAILDYFKTHNLYGEIDSAVSDDPDLSRQAASCDKGWQVFCKPKKSKYNNVVFPRLSNRHSKYTDFGVIIKNVYTGERRFFMYSFDDDETFHFMCEAQNLSSDGPIKAVIKDWYTGAYRIFFIDE